MTAMTTILVYFLAILLCAFLVFSYIHHRKQKQYLYRQLKIDNKTKEEFKNRFGLLESTLVGVSIFDVLYNIGKMDPFVLAGVDHLHHMQNFESLRQLSNYVRANIVDSEIGTNAWRKMLHKYKGYTGEESSFQKIRESGQNIEIPSSGTNPGFDAIVDGQKYNMAVTYNPSYIQHKLDTLPEDIHIWTNKEMSDQFIDNPRVHIDADLSVQESFHLTNDTFEGITELVDYIDDIPVLTLAFSGIKNGIGVAKGNKKILDAIEQTILDTAGVGFGYAGSALGFEIGLAFAPVTGGTSAILIPVASTIIGSLLGIFTGKSTKNWFKYRHLRGAVEELNNESDKFIELYLQYYREIIKKISIRYKMQKNKLNFAYKNTEVWYKRYFFPCVMTKYYRLAIGKSKEEFIKTSNYYHKLAFTIQEKTPEAGIILYSQGKGILLNFKELINSWNEVHLKVKKVEQEKKRIS